jgi:hypothetical protein
MKPISDTHWTIRHPSAYRFGVVYALVRCDNSGRHLLGKENIDAIFDRTTFEELEVLSFLLHEKINLK